MVSALPASGFVLTGGGSKRMGRDKALLELAGQPLVLRAVERLRPLVAEVALVGAPERYAYLGVPTLADREPGRGPLGGIVTALGASRHDWNLIVSCDLPYLEERFLRSLLERAAQEAGFDAFVPCTEEHQQPLCALYHRRCLAAFARVLAAGEGKIARALAEVRVRAILPQEWRRFAFSDRMFKNMNTREDYAEAQRLLGK